MKAKIHTFKEELIDGVERRDKRISDYDLNPAELCALRNQNNIINSVISRLDKILKEGKQNE